MNMPTEMITFATILAPIVAAIIQGVKNAAPISKNYVPLIAVVVGLILGFVAAPLTDIDVQLRLWGGGLAGLASTGLYELAFNKRTGSTK